MYDPTTGNPTQRKRSDRICGQSDSDRQNLPSGVKTFWRNCQLPQTRRCTEQLRWCWIGSIHAEQLRHAHRLHRQPELERFGRFSLSYYSLSGKGLLAQWGARATVLLGLSGSSITHNYSLATGFNKTISTSVADRFPLWILQVQSRSRQSPIGGTPMTDFGILGGANDLDAIPGPPDWAPSNSVRIRSAATTDLPTTAVQDS